VSVVVHFVDLFLVGARSFCLVLPYPGLSYPVFPYLVMSYRVVLSCQRHLKMDGNHLTYAKEKGSPPKFEYDIDDTCKVETLRGSRPNCAEGDSYDIVIQFTTEGWKAVFSFDNEPSRAKWHTALMAATSQTHRSLSPVSISSETAPPVKAAPSVETALLSKRTIATLKEHGIKGTHFMEANLWWRACRATCLPGCEPDIYEAVQLWLDWYECQV
jgi:hypothetical protein